MVDANTGNTEDVDSFDQMVGIITVNAEVFDQMVEVMAVKFDVFRLRSLLPILTCSDRWYGH